MNLMDVPYAELERWKSGDSYTKEHLNQPVDALNILRDRSVDPPRQKFPTPRRTAVARASASGLLLVLFVKEEADYLVCITDDDATVVNVAKRPELQKRYLDGETIDDNGILKTYEYQPDFSRKETIEATGAVEIHRITPMYYPLKPMLVERFDLGLKTLPTEEVPEPVDIVHVYNADNRVWGEEE